MSDNIQAVWDRFNQQRTEPLRHRFNGLYRALVVETNDPERMYRVRFKCAELHDFDLKPEECPWAIPDPEMGAHRSGRWTHPCINDWVWIKFEKNHPYGPIWSGFATPTRRKMYPYPSIFGKTPLPVDEQSNLQSQPNDYLQDYLPQDERPMGHGWNDRYGNLDISNSVGYYPSSHNIAPPPPDTDNLTKSNFQQATSKPVANSPDSKYMARLSKYGNLILQSDVGYTWKQDGGAGEFTGDFAGDEQFEITRWQYMQKVIHENAPKNRDQRRLMLLSRYGHKFEMRDVGWVHSRDGEFGAQTKLATAGSDERWMKMRTKGGHLIEAIDIGCDEKEDDFVKRQVLDEVSAPTPLDQEDKFGSDARQIRFVTRSGRKIVIDDRGSDPKKAQDTSLDNSKIGYGILIKGRASPGASNDYSSQSGSPKGYYWQIDERPDFNHTVWGSPLGQVMEMSDDNEAIVICSRLPDLPMDCKFLSDNEFLDKSAFSLTPEHNTHHLYIDLQREIIRLKSRAGHGQAPHNPKSGDGASGEYAGIEIHDAPSDNPWVELVDHDKRGMWLSRKEKLGIWRASVADNKDMYVWMDEQNNIVAIRNGTSGKIQVFCTGNIEIISNGDTNIQSSGVITLKADSSINMQVGGGRYRFGSDAFDTNVDIKGRNIFGLFPQIHDGNGGPPGAPSGQGADVSNISAVSVPTKEPDNRL